MNGYLRQARSAVRSTPDDRRGRDQVYLVNRFTRYMTFTHTHTKLLSNAIYRSDVTYGRLDGKLTSANITMYT